MRDLTFNDDIVPIAISRRAVGLYRGELLPKSFENTTILGRPVPEREMILHQEEPINDDIFQEAKDIIRVTERKLNDDNIPERRDNLTQTENIQDSQSILTFGLLAVGAFLLFN